MKELELTYTINAPAEKVWLALTDAAMAEAWGAGPAQVNPVEGGEFSYWDGDIHGFFTKIIPPFIIEQDWFGHDNPFDMFKVLFSFEETEGVTTVHLIFAGNIVDPEKDIANWTNYYFDPIKKLLEQQ